MKENILIEEIAPVSLLAWELGINELYKDKNNSLFVDALEKMFRLFPNGFARHCEHRKDQINLHGLSWTEELNLSRYFVKKIFGEIGIHYSSREEYEKAEDKFRGRYYCSVYDASNHHRTFYYRNYELFARLSAEFEAICKLPQSKEDLNIGLAE
jgi:hypothetical protein